jgi:ketosteroid isomerase-like protein
MNRREAVIAGMTSLAAAVGVASAADEQTSDAEAESPELEPLRTLLNAYLTVFNNQDLEGVLATMSDKAAIMGTGPGEVWSGPDELKAAYRYFFEGFDMGQQTFDYEFSLGQITGDSGWLMTSGNVGGTKDGKDFTFPVNLSVVASKAGDKWVINAMHFSILSGESDDEQGDE